MSYRKCRGAFTNPRRIKHSTVWIQVSKLSLCINLELELNWKLSCGFHRRRRSSSWGPKTRILARIWIWRTCLPCALASPYSPPGRWGRPYHALLTSRGYPCTRPRGCRPHLCAAAAIVAGGGAALGGPAFLAGGGAALGGPAFLGRCVLLREGGRGRGFVWGGGAREGLRACGGRDWDADVSGGEGAALFCK